MSLLLQASIFCAQQTACHIDVIVLIVSALFSCSFKSIIPVVGNLDLSPLAAFAFMGFFESLIGINEKSLKESSLWGATS